MCVGSVWWDRSGWIDWVGGFGGIDLVGSVQLDWSSWIGGVGPGRSDQFGGVPLGWICRHLVASLVILCDLAILGCYRVTLGCLRPSGVTLDYPVSSRCFLRSSCVLSC